MFATNTALLSTTYAGRDRAVAFGVWGAVTGAAAAIAPVLGGLLIQAFDWRAIFLVNLPIAMLAIALTRRVLAESRGEDGPIDWLGAASFTLCAGALTFGLIHGGSAGWSAAATLAAFAAAVLALAAFVVVERRRNKPLLDLAVLRDPSFAALSILRAGIAAQSSWTVLIPGLVVTGLGVGLASPVLVSAALAAVPARRAGMASGAVNTFRQLGYALGIAVLGTLFASHLQRSLASSGAFSNPAAASTQAAQGQAHVLISGAPAGSRAAVSHAIHAAYALSQNDIYLLAGAAAILGGVLVLALVRPAPRSELVAAVS